jgi:hypothetical protein
MSDPTASDPSDPSGLPPRPHHPVAVRAAVGVVLPLVIVGFAVAPLVIERGNLPDPLATHWSLTGTPDGSTSTAAFTVLVVVMTVLPGLLAFAVSRRSHPVAYEIAPAAALTASFAGVWAAVSASTVWANRGVAVWSDARSNGLLTTLAVLVVAAAVGAISFQLARRLEHARDERVAADRPTIGLRPSERAQWVGRCRSTFAWPMVVGFGTAAVVVPPLAALVGAPRESWIAVVSLVLAAAALPFISIRVVVDRRGLRAELGPAGWPTVSFPLADIVAAEHVPDAIPVRSGGWGYRGSVRVFGRAALVLRRGDAIRLVLRGDRTFLVTVDDAATGAGLLNDLQPTTSA